ncbi:MAG: hypothetical protein F6K08_02385 [Okeania sp. SIO1H6]|nr:hypothetical protein [Okeania sp. SIO1H6]
MASRIEECDRRWLIWVRSGVPRVELGRVVEEADDGRNHSTQIEFFRHTLVLDLSID